MCIRDQKSEAASPEVVIVDLKNGNNVTRRPIKADSAIMHWSRQVIALKAQSRTLQIFDLEQKQKLKSTTMNEDVQYWKWISPTSLGLVTDASVYHWDVFDTSQPAPVKVFERNANLTVRFYIIPFSTRTSFPAATFLALHTSPPFPTLVPSLLYLLSLTFQLLGLPNYQLSY